MKTYQALTFIKRYFGQFNETQSPEIEVANLKEAHKKAKKSDGCFGYRVHSREYVKVNGRRFYAPEATCVKNVVFGQVLNRQQVEALPGVGKYLILQEMNDRKDDTVVRLCTGRFVSPTEFKDVTFVDC